MIMIPCVILFGHSWILLLFLLFLILLIPLAYLVVFLKTESAAVVVIENFEK